MNNLNWENGLKRIVIVLSIFIFPIGLFFFISGISESNEEAKGLGTLLLVFAAFLWIILYAVKWIIKGFTKK